MLKDMDNLLRMEKISKSFPGVKALDSVHFELKRGEVHAIAGENGAGKSTFMKVLTGIYKQDEGEIYYKGNLFLPENPKHAQDMGISIIHQELNLLPDLSVANNIYISREPRKVRGIIDDKEMNEKAQALLDSMGLSINAQTEVKDLSIASRQMVEIAKALSVHSDVLVLDEPTSSLSLSETETLFNIIRKLRDEGVGIIYISHRLEEFDDIVDRVTVLRDGKYITTQPWSKEYNIPQLIRDMVGREMNEEFPKRNSTIGDVIFEVKNLTRVVNEKKIFDNVSFSVRSGEVLGIAGLVGAGRTEIARAIIGADRATSGEVWLKGEKCSIKAPIDAIRHGITYLPEDRKDTGLFLDQSVTFNMVAATFSDWAKQGIVNDRIIKKVVDEKVDQLRIKTPNNEQILQYLSGGNQQKVLIGRWLCRNFDVVIFDEPTRGIDVGAKYEVFALINKIAERGAAVIVISSEMNEVMGLSDRILVVSEGRVSGEIDAADATQEQIMILASKTKNYEECEDKV